MSASPPLGLFQPAHQGHNLATLVLIENSAAMIDRWPDLRDHYLPTLLGTVRKVNPVVPVCCLTLLRSTCPYPLTSSFILSLPLSTSPDSSTLGHQLSCFSLRGRRRSFQQLTPVQSTARDPF
jgi:hypothetical protein